MTPAEFHAAVMLPEGLSPALQALWWQARGDWAAAHATVQADDGAEAAWVHALLHRAEGDLANADYWYRRASRSRPTVPLAEEWREIVEALLAAASP